MLLLLLLLLLLHNAHKIASTPALPSHSFLLNSSFSLSFSRAFFFISSHLTSASALDSPPCVCV